MLAAISAQAVLAADTVAISAEKVTAEAGSTFTLNVELKDVPAAGIAVCDFSVTYDSDVVTVTSITPGKITQTGVDSVENFEGLSAFEADFSTAGVINATFTTGQLDDSTYWIKDDGVYFTITGTVNADAQVGDSTDFVIGGINRSTTSGSTETNTEVKIGSIDSSLQVTKYATTLSNGSLTVVGSSTGDTLYGDANCDGSVNILDVIALNKSLMGSSSLTAQGATNSDVDLDGTPTASDSLNIMRYVVKLISQLPV
jgi:hypothetical protein